MRSIEGLAHALVLVTVDYESKLVDVRIVDGFYCLLFKYYER